MTPFARLRPDCARCALGALCLSLLVCLRATIAWGSPEDEDHDPVPIRRVPVTREDLPEKLKLAKQGVLVALSRKAFEQRVRAAARVQESARVPPRLLESHYKATFDPEGLRGTARWKVFQSLDLPGILALQPFNLVPEQPRIDNIEALLGDLDGKAPGLLVESKGEHLVTMNWTARAEAGPGGFQVELEVPSAPQSDLELYLPRDLRISVSTTGCLLTGPHPSDREDFQLWRLNFARLSQLHLVIRPADDAHSPRPLIESRLHTIQRIQPDGLDAEYNFEIKVLHRGVRELRFILDPGLQVTAVGSGDKRGPPASSSGIEPGTLQSFAGMEDYRVLPGKAGAPSVLLVRMRDEFQAGNLRVICRGRLPFCRPGHIETWMSPGAALVGGILLGETCSLHVSPEVTLESWQGGSFHLDHASAGTEGTQEIALEGGGRDTAPTERAASTNRPTAKLYRLIPEYLVHQELWWQMNRPIPLVTGAFRIEMNAGRLQQIRFQLPQDWEPEHVSTTPPDLLSHWRTEQQGATSTLAVVLNRTLAAPSPRAVSEDAGSRQLSSATLVLHLRRKSGIPAPHVGAPINLPDIVPVGARWREGGIGIAYDETLYEARLSPRGLDSATAAALGPWAEHLPQIYLPFRGEPLRGAVTLVPRALRLRASCSSEVVFLSSRRVVVEARVEVKLDVGNLDTLEVSLSSPLAAGWTMREWRSEDGRLPIRKVQHLPDPELPAWLSLLGIGSPWQFQAVAACRLAHCEQARRGERWRIHFAGPLNSSHPVVLRCELQRPLPEHAFEVPLPGVEGAGNLDGEAKLFLSGINVVPLAWEGLQEQPGNGSRNAGPTPWRTFHYSALPVALKLQGSSPSADRSAEVDADDISLTTYVESSGRLLHHYRFRLRSLQWRGALPPVGAALPDDAQPLGIRVDGRWLDRVDLSALPMAGRTTDHRCEIIYTTPAVPFWLWKKVRAPEPRLSVRAGGCRHLWCLPAGVAPLKESGLRQVLGPAGSGALGALDRFGLPHWTIPGNGRTRTSELARASSLIQDGSRDVALHTPEGQLLTLGALLERLQVDFLDDQPGRDGILLTVDTAALADAGLSPPTLLPMHARRPVEDWMSQLGMTLVCGGPDAIVLTTEQQARRWESSGTARSTLPMRFESEVAQAVHHGQDSSGRFQTVPTWLSLHSSSLAASTDGAGARELAWFSERIGNEWTQWEAAGPDAAEPGLVVFRSRGVPLAGVALAVLLGLCFGLLGKRRRAAGIPAARRTGRRFLFLVCWLALAGLSAIWLPSALRPVAFWPLAAAVAIALVWYLRSVVLTGVVAAERRPSTMIQTASGFSSAVAVVLALGATAALDELFARAEGPTTPEARPPATVFVLPDSLDGTTGPQVLAPEELLTQLDALARVVPPGLQDVVLTSAEYRGRVAGDEAVFDAVFKANCFRDPGERAVVLTVPLAGVQIRNAWLDGAATAPIALGQPVRGWQFLVKGRGAHSLVLGFSVPIRKNGAERELKFRLPPVLQSRMEFSAVEGAAYLSARALQTPAHGRQTVYDDAIYRRLGRLLAAGPGGPLAAALYLQRGPAEPPVLRADLGRLDSPLQVRWREQDGATLASACEIRDAYLWTVRPNSSSLTALIRYSPAKPLNPSECAVSDMDFELPPGLEVESVEALSLASPDRVPLRLREWYVQPAQGKRLLRLRLARPAAGAVEVELHLIGASSSGGTLDLLVPTPLETPSMKLVESLLGYRLEGIDAAKFERRQCVPIETARFRRFFGQLEKSGRPAAGEIREAFLLRRLLDDPAAARLHRQHRPLAIKAVQDLTWCVGLQFAVLEAQCKLPPGQDDLPLAEWDIPAAVQITRVAGKDVRSWTRSGSRLQIWLERPHDDKSKRGEIALTLSGWQKLDAAQPTQFTLPPFRFLSAPAQDQDTTVHVVPAAGIMLEGPGIPGAAIPRAGHPAAELHYHQAFPKASFRVHRAAELDVRSLNLLEVTDAKLRCTAIVECQSRHVELSGLHVRLHNWPGDQVEIDAPQLVGRPRARRDGNDLVWALEFRPALAGHFRFNVTAAAAAPERLGPSLVMPSIAVDEAIPERTQTWLAVDKDLAVQTTQGVSAVTIPETAAAWSADRARLRNSSFNCWKTTAKDWALALTPRQGASAGSSVRTVLTDHVATVLDGRRWTHQATYWIHHDANTDLAFAVRAGAHILAVGVDGVEVTPLQPSPERLWVPLAGSAGCVRIDLRWQFHEDEETLEHPDPSVPLIDGALPGPVLWTVYVPDGLHVVSQDLRDGQAKQSGAAGAYLARAGAQLRLAALTAPQVHDSGEASAAQFLAAEVGFFRNYLAAQCELAQPAGSGVSPGTTQRKLTEKLQALQKENINLCRQPQLLDDLRTRAERGDGAGAAAGAPMASPQEGSRLASLLLQGTPEVWKADSPAQLPNVRLLGEREQQLGRGRLRTALLMVLIGIAALGWYWRPAPRWLRRTWPEQMVLLGLGIGLVESSMVPIMSGVLIGAAARLLMLARTLARRWRPTPKAPASSVHANTAS